MKSYKYDKNTSKEDLLKAVTNLQVRLEEAYKREETLTRKLLESRRKLFVEFNNEECWAWDSTDVGSNYIESLVCPVVIEPSILQSYLKSVGEL